MSTVLAPAPVRTAAVMAGMKILIIEDERALTDVLTYNLRRDGYETSVAHDGQEGLRKAQTTLPDLIILDLMLPLLSGIDVCRELRAGERTREIPIIILTAKAEEMDQLVGFSMGADDYVTKPFSVKVLLQRVKALQRRREGAQEASDIVEHLSVRLDRVRHRVQAEGKDVELTPTEFRLLECLLRQPGRAFTRAQLLDAAIGDGAVVLERTIDVHVKTLRRKLGSGDLIETVRGVGYRFRETPPPEASRA
ncbi:MAG TPA: response regulator transcription factor [Gemmataceae bacterium]|nr:response regulator transcription factor [Gemmataceae bacterium]